MYTWIDVHLLPISPPWHTTERRCDGGNMDGWCIEKSVCHYALKLIDVFPIPYYYQACHNIVHWRLVTQRDVSLQTHQNMIFLVWIAFKLQDNAFQLFHQQCFIKPILTLLLSLFYMLLLLSKHVHQNCNMFFSKNVCGCPFNKYIVKGRIYIALIPEDCLLSQWWTSHTKQRGS